MNRWIAAIVLPLVAVAGLAALALRYPPPRGISRQELDSLRAQMHALENRLDEYDLAVAWTQRRLGRRGDDPGLEQLKAGHARGWRNYRNQRRQLAAALEEHPLVTLLEPVLSPLRALGRTTFAFVGAALLVVFAGRWSRRRRLKRRNPATAPMPAGKWKETIRDLEQLGAEQLSRDDQGTAQLSPAPVLESVSEPEDAPPAGYDTPSPHALVTSHANSSSEGAAAPGRGDEASPSPEGDGAGWSRFEGERRRREDVLRLARRGSTPSEIAKRLTIDQGEVEELIRAHLE